MSGQPCECGCGELARPGNRFVRSHHVRTRPPAKPAKYATCPRCGRRVRLRVNGSFCRHEQRSGVAPVHCPEGLIGARPAPAGVRVRLVLDVIIPAGWSRLEVQRNVRVALQERAEEAFLIDMDMTTTNDERTRT